MKKLSIAIVGYGNIGKYAEEAVLAAPDMTLAGIVRRSASESRTAAGSLVCDDIAALGKVDAAILCVPSRSVAEHAEKYLAMGISTVDSFDMHADIVALRSRLDTAAKAGGCAAVLSAGWDPGSDSVVRALLEACAPLGITHTNFGPGMSMGHTVAAKAVSGVRAALSMTMPTGAGVHRRMVYVELTEGADFATVEAAIKADPYFVNDDTRVIKTADIGALTDVGHGVSMQRKGVSGRTHNQNFSFSMSVNNPALTSQLMVCCARAAARATARQHYGAYTMIELPVIDLLPGDRDDIIRRIV